MEDRLLPKSETEESEEEEVRSMPVPGMSFFARKPSYFEEKFHDEL